jgi:hypothetical protein
MAKPIKLTYIKASLDDKPGALLGILKTLKSQNLGLIALWAYGALQERTDLYLIAKNPEKVKNFLQASRMFIAEGTGFWIKGTDKTGALLKPLEVIANAGINIAGTHALAVGGKFGSFLRVAPDDVEKMGRALGAK